MTFVASATASLTLKVRLGADDLRLGGRRGWRWWVSVRGMTDTFADVRELLYGDAPLSRLTGSGSDAPPWTLFRRAADCLDRGDTTGAEQALDEVLSLPDAESRVYLQAW